MASTNPKSGGRTVAQLSDDSQFGLQVITRLKLPHVSKPRKTEVVLCSAPAPDRRLRSGAAGWWAVGFTLPESRVGFGVLLRKISLPGAIFAV